MRIALVTAFVLAAFTAAGCGSSNDKSDASEASSSSPTKVTVTMNPSGLVANPNRVAFEPEEGQQISGEGKLILSFVIVNNLDHPSVFEVHEGPYVSDDENSEPVPAHGTGVLKTDLATGTYKLSGTGTPNSGNAGPPNDEFVVGPELAPAPGNTAEP